MFGALGISGADVAASSGPLKAVCLPACEPASVANEFSITTGIFPLPCSLLSNSPIRIIWGGIQCRAPWPLWRCPIQAAKHPSVCLSFVRLSVCPFSSMYTLMILANGTVLQSAFLFVHLFGPPTCLSTCPICLSTCPICLSTCPICLSTCPAASYSNIYPLTYPFEHWRRAHRRIVAGPPRCHWPTGGR